MVEEGKKAPAFSLPDQNANRVKLADYAGKWLVLFVYPKANTPGCTQEACGFRDLAADFAKAGASIVGLSKDTPAAQKKWEEKYALPYPLLSDPDAAVMTKYGAWGEKIMYGKKVTGAIRSTFLIAPDGTVAKAWRKVKITGHVDEVLAALKEAK
ncbi:MAG: thioredoxin-dependent thiol peroxidase [Nitrospinae bacterium]|nr:thioredoxin-dependent thiol peroxidase [Nitrospinota bacterium]